MTLDTVENILSFAIKNEEDTIRFYEHLASLADFRQVKDAFLEFAQEEREQKDLLEQIKAGETRFPEPRDVKDLGICDHFKDINVEETCLDYQEVLIVAMKIEKAAFRLYHGLAKATDDPQLKETLLGLAQKEAEHKLRFELEYDEKVLTED